MEDMEKTRKRLQEITRRAERLLDLLKKSILPSPLIMQIDNTADHNHDFRLIFRFTDNDDDKKRLVLECKRAQYIHLTGFSFAEGNESLTLCAKMPREYLAATKRSRVINGVAIPCFRINLERALTQNACVFLEAAGEVTTIRKENEVDKFTKEVIAELNDKLKYINRALKQPPAPAP